MKDTVTTTEVYMTKDYSKFKEHHAQPTNRTRAYTSLVNSLKLTNGNKLNPIIVSAKTMEIIDGTRRWKSSMISGTPLYYIMVGMEEEDAFMIALNSTGRQWTTQNYINSHARSKKEYKKLEAFLSKNGASLEFIKLFANGISLGMLRNGADVDHLIDYEFLETVRRAVLFIGGKFDVGTTIAQRGLRMLAKEFEEVDYNELVGAIERAHKRGDYEGLAFITNKDKLYNVLKTTYKRKDK